jgi:DNA-binding transcriptional MocR family regulator
MRLSYSCATPDQIDVGIDALAQTIRDELGQSTTA